MLLISVIPEVKGGAHKDVNDQAAKIEVVLKKSLKELLAMEEKQLVTHRYNKFKRIGEISLLKDIIGVN